MSTLHNSVFDDGLDGGLQNIAAAGDLDFCVCSAEPTTYAEAVTTYNLGTASAHTITGPADGDTSGRKVTIDAVSATAVSAAGTATHIALVDTNTSTLLLTHALDSSVALSLGQNFSANAFDLEIPDPA